jgi:hypothetical protein
MYLYLFFVSKQQWRHFGKRTQCGIVLREMLTEATLYAKIAIKKNC